MRNVGCMVGMVIMKVTSDWLRGSMWENSQTKNKNTATLQLSCFCEVSISAQLTVYDDSNGSVSIGESVRRRCCVMENNKKLFQLFRPMMCSGQRTSRRGEKSYRLIELRRIFCAWIWWNNRWKIKVKFFTHFFSSLVGWQWRLVVNNLIFIYFIEFHLRCFYFLSNCFRELDI